MPHFAGGCGRGLVNQAKQWLSLRRSSKDFFLSGFHFSRIGFASVVETVQV
jgi:hypothetical protein